jgi:serine/threonine-protein kinase
MTVTPGAWLGPYEITGALGAGGMGEVYRARDTRLKREVALKILPSAVAADADRLARFQREAEVLASLNHPNIAAIYGLEEGPAEGGPHNSVGAGFSRPMHAIVMELVEGETLADRIARGAVALDEALPIARQIAEALEAAHEQGIIHRDLKPANIKLRLDGTVKVLDFGLAKLNGPNVSNDPNDPNALSLSPTITSPALMTGVGVLLGTAAYMSPEQAKGRPADKRSDIWAFGCVLFEMLTGRRPFEGEDVADTLANVLKTQPDWEALPSDVPPAVVALIRGSLDKDRRRRIADVAAALFVLTQPLYSFGETLQGRHSNAPYRRVAIAAAFVAVAGVAAGGWWLGARSRPVDSKPVTRFIVPLRSDEQFATNGRRFIALSPDGTHLAYIANGRVNVRALDRLESVAIPSTASGLGALGTPFFSPDGQWIGFWQEGQIKKVRVDGGATVAIVPAANAAGLAWEDDGTILFASEGSILRVSEAGGTPEVLVGNLKGRVQSVQLLPGKRTMLFTLFPEGTLSRSEIIVRSLETGEQQTLIRDGIDARYVPTGHIVYFAGGNLLAVPFDLGTRRIRGSPAPVADNVTTSGVPGRAINVAHVAISQTGTLAFVAGSFVERSPRTLVWVDRRGNEEPLGVPERPYVYPRLSPDGGRIAVTIGDQERDIWIWDISRKTLRRFTLNPGEDRYAAWTPDGKRLAFGSSQGDERGVWWQLADGSGVPERLAGFPINRFGNFVPTTISPDGSRMITTATGAGAGGGSDLWVLSLVGSPQPAPLLDTPNGERNGEISPDGRWMAYESVEAGRVEVYVRPFPNIAGGKWPVSTGGGSQPLWARTGKELFYLDPAGALMGVSVEGQTSFAIGTPARILDGVYVTSLPTYAGRLYDISPDSQRFLMLKQSASGAQTNGASSITVVQNWTEELKRLVPTN